MYMQSVIMMNLLIIILLLLSPILLLFVYPPVYLLVIGLFTAFLFAVDKVAALWGKSRIPEKTLLLACIMGGAIFALVAMILCHHKTSKPKFYIPVLLIIFIQAVLLIFI